MKLVYTDEVIEFDGKTFSVLDTEKIDFAGARKGVKSSLTKVCRAKGTEKIITANSNGVESVVVAEKDDAIFCNSDIDIYVANTNGVHWHFDEIEEHGYTIVERVNDDCVYIRSNNQAYLLHEVIEKNSVIKDAFGEGNNQYLYKGATLKKDIKTGRITGIEKQAFDQTWMFLD